MSDGVRESKYLKKYTHIKYLRGILKENSLHLGAPSSWPDKNDKFSVEHAYGRNARVLCLTGGADRYHFWTDYGGGTCSVCLWFSRKMIIEDLQRTSYTHDSVVYPVWEQKKRSFRFTQKSPRPISSAFVKREQYRDEKEFRIVSNGGGNERFQFPKLSLKKIFISSWLEESSAKLVIGRINDTLTEYGYQQNTVCVRQNKVTDHKEWQKALRDQFSIKP